MNPESLAEGLIAVIRCVFTCQRDETKVPSARGACAAWPPLTLPLDLFLHLPLFISALPVCA